MRLLRLAPGHHADDAEIHERVDGGHPQHRVDDGAGNDAGGIAHFAADVADIVVAHEIVHGDQHGGAESRGESARKRECLGRKIERHPRVEVRHAARHDPKRGHQNPHPQRHRDPPDGGNPAVEQGDHQHSHGDVHHAPLGRRHAAPEIADILRKTDVPGGNLQRAAENELPDEQERQDAAQPGFAKRFAQVEVCAPRPRQRGGQFAPHQPVRQCQHRAQKPAQHALWAAHCRDNQWDRNERSGPYHVAHIERHGLQGTESAD